MSQNGPDRFGSNANSPDWRLKFVGNLGVDAVVMRGEAYESNATRGLASQVDDPRMGIACVGKLLSSGFGAFTGGGATKVASHLWIGHERHHQRCVINGWRHNQAT